MSKTSAITVWTYKIASLSSIGKFKEKKILTATNASRYHLLDTIRGITVISMVLYHLIWDLVYICGVKWSWFETGLAYIWQQSICWVFILLSGFCWSLSKRNCQRGLLVFGAGILVSVITFLFVPEYKILFGILTCLGSCMLLLIPLNKILVRVTPWKGFLVSILLFILSHNINEGYLGFEMWNLVKLPKFLYVGNFMTFLGFMDAGFNSYDYFSIFPWFFLFLVGYFTFHMLNGKNKRLPMVFHRGKSVFEVFGKHTLFIYLVHQPIIYFGLTILMSKMRP